jgi:hypothetical protein
MTTPEPTLYRAQLVRLPLQQATFGRSGRAGGVLPIAGPLGERDLEARLDVEGNLHLDAERGRELAGALTATLTERSAGALEDALNQACAGLTDAIEAGSDAAMGGRPDREAHLSTMADRIADVLDFAILGRFVPDALLNGLSFAGDRRPPPFPTPSAGARLSRELLDLYVTITSTGLHPADLVTAAGSLDPHLEGELRSFARRFTGFGPLAWDRPGFEEPRHVLAAMVAAFEGARDGVPTPHPQGTLIEPLESPSAGPPSDPGTFPVGPARRLLGRWLAFLDEETWYMRRAFFLGLSPVFRSLMAEHRGAHPDLRPGDVLFCRSLAEPLSDPTEWAAQARARRAALMEDRPYLAAHAIDEGRLDGMVEGPWDAT